MPKDRGKLHPTHQLNSCQALPFVVMRRAEQSSDCYHTHSHDEFSFGVIDAGEADYRNMNQQHHIGAGVTVTINPGDAHSCNPRTGPWSYRMLFVDTPWIGRLQQEMLGTHTTDYLPFNQHFEHHPLIGQAFHRLYEQLADEANPLVAESLLIRFIEQLFVVNGGYQAINTPDDAYRLRQVKEMIMDQLHENISLDEFSHQSGLSRYHLIRSFKQRYGQAPHAFQLDQRINKSKLLLQQGNSLAETAGLLGFADQSHFQRHFKKRLALTPKQYQSFFSVQPKGVNSAKVIYG